MMPRVVKMLRMPLQQQRLNDGFAGTAVAPQIQIPASAAAAAVPEPTVTLILFSPIILPSASSQARIGSDCIPYAPESRQLFLIRALDRGRIIKWPVQPSRDARKDRAAFFGVAAHGDQIAEVHLAQVNPQILRGLARHVDADFGQHLAGIRVDPLGTPTRRYAPQNGRRRAAARRLSHLATRRSCRCRGRGRGFCLPSV